MQGHETLVASFIDMEMFNFIKTLVSKSLSTITSDRLPFLLTESVTLIVMVWERCGAVCPASLMSLSARIIEGGSQITNQENIIPDFQNLKSP